MSDRLRILIVDDSLLARMMMRKFITDYSADVEILEGRDGPSVLAAPPPAGFDVAFIDYNMPGLNGLELGTALRRLQPAARLVLVTANLQDFVRQDCHAIGMDYIAKPITFDKVAAYLRGVEPRR